jgi:hypothetical protein
MSCTGKLWLLGIDAPQGPKVSQFQDFGPVVNGDSARPTGWNVLTYPELPGSSSEIADMFFKEHIEVGKC